MGPPGPQSTLNLSLAGAVDEEVSFRCRDLEDFSNSGAEESLSLESQLGVDTARRQNTVTQSAVHSTSISTRPAVSFTHLRSSQPCLVPHNENVVRTARPPSLQLWRTGVAGQHACNPSPSDPQVQRVTQEGMMTTSSAVDGSDNVTSGAQRGAQVHNPSGHYTDKFDYNDHLRERSGVFLSSQFLNENAMQPSQEFVSCSSNVSNINPCMPAGLGGRADIRATGFAREQLVRGLQPGYRGGQSFGGEKQKFSVE